MKKVISSILLGILLLTVMPKPIANAASTVSVTLPKFPVSLNGQQISNDYSQYPLLVYKNITYFPMTYYDCRLLGLRTTWSETDGLSIDKDSTPLSEYVREVQSSRNALKQSAQIASSKISVNGKKIDNSKEPYPVLQFRNVVYFPLTWLISGRHPCHRALKGRQEFFCLSYSERLLSHGQERGLIPKRE